MLVFGGEQKRTRIDCPVRYTYPALSVTGASLRPVFHTGSSYRGLGQCQAFDVLLIQVTQGVMLLTEVSWASGTYLRRYMKLVGQDTNIIKVS